MNSKEYDALMGTLVTLLSVMAQHGLDAHAFMGAIQASAEHMKAHGKADGAQLMLEDVGSALASLGLLQAPAGTPQ